MYFDINTVINSRFRQINLLTCVLDSTPILPEEVAGDSLKILRHGPQCVAFGVFIIWFSSVTLNLGPTFLSGAISSGLAELQPSCPLVQVTVCHIERCRI